MAEGGNISQDISFAWEDEPWMALSNSDNSATGSDENLSQKMNTTNSPTAPAAEEPTAANKAAAGMPPPPPPAPGKRKRRNGKQEAAAGGGKKGGETDHELHIYTERERRKRMRNMFSSLLELLPHLPQKADKSTIVDEGVNYIKTLQQQLQKLQRQKLEMLQGLTTMANYPPQAPPYRSAAAMEAMEASSSREAFLANLQGSSSSALTQDQEMTMTPPFGMARYSTGFKTWASPNLVLSVCGDKAQINICCPKKLGVFSAICYFLEKHKLQVLSAHISSDQYRSMFMIQAHATAGVDQLSEGALSIEDIFQLATGEIMLHLSTL
ncbi:OLC1v1000073C1 [Oldenlandia corymbosa var. corymbosa]|uniref:OLC1v1000073C1 n=1 Tax=Oldenlandia corymbosa var. corymbosa TaxID=529605 RepID=A0AAV1D4Z9_OLDCO|nr:OLC1v1000073C1 [Oldenlandia corymbosa var. corymbosa]